jgi:uncharacterized membrane protein YfcA
MRKRNYSGGRASTRRPLAVKIPAAFMNNNDSRFFFRLSCRLGAFLATSWPDLACAAGGAEAVAWWAWPLALFLVCFVLGMIAVPAGIGGGVLFVPIVSGFFPFHLDFVRGAGLLVALSGALAAGPGLLRGGLADLRLALPPTLLASIGAIAGAFIGLAMPADVIEIALGFTILGISGLMWRAKKSEHPDVSRPDALGVALRMSGIFHDPALRRDIAWQVHRTPLGLLLFAGIGVLAGLFGLGAGWANVPVLNLVMGVPLKLSAGTSGFILSIVDSSAAWVYINKGALLAVVAVPSVIGMMLGAFIGARLLRIMDASVIRRLVIVILLFAGARALTKGLGWWV